MVVARYAAGMKVVAPLIYTNFWVFLKVGSRFIKRSRRSAELQAVVLALGVPLITWGGGLRKLFMPEASFLNRCEHATSTGTKTSCLNP
jgi:hypothetical protein